MVMIDDKDLEEYTELDKQGTKETAELEEKTEEDEDGEEGEVDIEKYKREFKKKRAPPPSASPPYKVHNEKQQVTLTPKISP